MGGIMAVKKEETKKTKSKTKSTPKIKEEQINVEELKKELNEYIDNQVKNTYNEKIENAHKKLIREKNKKIIARNITIVLLILLIVFLAYLLYKADYFDKYFVNKNEVVETTKKEVTEGEEEKVPTLEELKVTYANYLDNIKISENSAYLNEYYTGSLSEELKNYLAFNTIDISSLSSAYNYNVIAKSTIENAYKILFNTDFTSIDFKYSSNNLRYIAMMDSYITDSLLTKEESNIQREIVDIQVNDNIKITTIEGIIKDNKVYNILTNEEIGDYTNLNDYSNSLSKVTYVFNKNKQLIEIEV